MCFLIGKPQSRKGQEAIMSSFVLKHSFSTQLRQKENRDNHTVAVTHLSVLRFFHCPLLWEVIGGLQLLPARQRHTVYRGINCG